MTALQLVGFPVLHRVGGFLQITANPSLDLIDIRALETAAEYINIDNQVLNVVNGSALRNATGYVFVNRCTTCLFPSFVGVIATSTVSPPCGAGRGDMFPLLRPSVAICITCVAGYYKSLSNYDVCSKCPSGQTSLPESTFCFDAGNCGVMIPEYGCVNNSVSIRAVGSSGSWSTPNSTVEFSNR